MENYVIKLDENQKKALELLGFDLTPLVSKDLLIFNPFNPYKVGDLVKLKVDVRDIHGKIWHDKEDIVQVSAIHPKGEHLIFKSSLKTHYLNVEKYEADK